MGNYFGKKTNEQCTQTVGTSVDSDFNTVCVPVQSIVGETIIYAITIQSCRLFTSFGTMESRAEDGTFNDYSIVYYESDSEPVKMPVKLLENHFNAKCRIEYGWLYIQRDICYGTFTMFLEDQENIVPDTTIQNVRVMRYERPQSFQQSYDNWDD